MPPLRSHVLLSLYRQFYNFKYYVVHVIGLNTELNKQVVIEGYSYILVFQINLSQYISLVMKAATEQPFAFRSNRRARYQRHHQGCTFLPQTKCALVPFRPRHAYFPSVSFTVIFLWSASIDSTNAYKQ